MEWFKIETWQDMLGYSILVIGLACAFIGVIGHWLAKGDERWKTENPAEDDVGEEFGVVLPFEQPEPQQKYGIWRKRP